jgi:hypothetical protein
MKIRDWDVWHVYASFLEGGKLDLQSAGSELVQSGFAVSVLHKDGDTWWLGADGVRKGVTTFEMSSENTSVNFSLDHDDTLDNDMSAYAMEGWKQACHFRFNEMRICPEGPLPAPYIRAMLGEIRLDCSNKELGIVLIPIVKIFESGVILVQFRALGGQRELLLDEFINRHVNLARSSFDDVEVSPELMNLAAKDSCHRMKKCSFMERIRINKALIQNQSEVAASTKEIESGDFIAKLTPMMRTEGKPETLASIAKTLFSTIGFVLSYPRSGLSFILRGQKQLIDAGNYWSGRPHVYLIDFKGQKTTAEKNIKKFSAELGAINTRTIKLELKPGVNYLPKDLRPFDDYSMHISEGGSLMVWSKNGKENQSENSDPNRGHLIYEHHAAIELVEYGYMLHRALLSKIENAAHLEGVHLLRWEVSSFQGEALSSAKFGEIRELFKAGWKALGLREVQELIENRLSIRKEQAAYAETLLRMGTDRWLTIIFGILAVPALADKLLKPIWSVFQWWRPVEGAFSDLYFIALATIIVTISVVSVVKAYKNKKIE